MSHPIRRLATLQSDVFLLNSQQGLFTVTFEPSSVKITTLRHPLSRSYGAILPSSLKRVISSTLPYSGYLPVSDYGTSSYILASNFSWQPGISNFPSAVALGPRRLSSYISIGLRAWTDTSNRLHCLASCVIRRMSACNWFRNINRTSIDYAFRPRLRID